MSAYFLLFILLGVLAICFVLAAILLRRGRLREPKKLGGSDEGDRSFAQALAAVRGRFAHSGIAQNLPWVLLIGERDSGKTTLLEALGASLQHDGTPAHGIQWRLLDQGAISEVPGDYLVTTEGKAQTDGRWTRLLRQLVYHRPNSPVNGLVLTVAATQLRPGDEVWTAKRRAVAAAIRSKLDDLQRETGLVVPVHVLVTKCDQIRGFGAFCWETPSALRDEMFGWGNPNTLESAFLPAWVDEAFDSLEESIVRQQLSAFGSRTSDVRADELTIFPLELDSLRNPLRTFLSEIFHETAYVDSNFFRGIFFCGDGSIIGRLPFPTGITVLEPSASLKAGAESSSLAAQVRAAVPVAISRRALFFVRHLFEYRVFAETRIVKPVTRIRFARRRMVLAAQLAILAFVLIFGIGTAGAWSRLRDLRDHRFTGLLNAISDALSQTGNQATPSVQTAYDLIDTLSTIQANGFESFFLPESWGDPLNARMADALAETFGRTVFPALSDALNQRGQTLLGSCKSIPLSVPQAEDNTIILRDVDFKKDPAYLVLARFDRQYGDWQEALRHYEMLRRLGTGSFSDLDALFVYLLGKGLRATDQTGASFYYRRALSSAIGYEVPITGASYEDNCSRELANSLVSNFYTSWFAGNPLLTSTNTVADGIDNLESGKIQQLDAAADLAQSISALDAQITNSNTKWLTQPDFDASTYPALNQLLSFRFMNSDLTAQIDTSGDEALTKLRQTLFSTGPGLPGTLLEQHGAQVRVSGNAIALEVGLQSLLHQDFAGTFSSSPSVGGKLIIWNPAALTQAGTLRDSYNKFVHAQLPLLPPTTQTSVQQLAARSVNSAVLSAVQNAEEPQQQIDNTTALLAIRSFNEAAPILTQLQSSLPGGAANSAGSFQMLLTQQGLTLAKWLNNLLATQPLYPFETRISPTYNGSTPVSFALFGVSSSDALDEYLASQRDRARSLVQDYARPLANYLQTHELEHVAGFDAWAGIAQDVNDYDAKKPGNAIANLETFIHSDLNKIALTDGCTASQMAIPSDDYFRQVRTQLQQVAVNACSQLALDTYQNEIANIFNAKLAGKFPFGPYPTQAGAPEADPYDVSDFLARISRWGPSLRQFFSTSPQYANELAFIQSCLRVKNMLAATDGNGSPAADVVVYFRVDRTAEQGGNEIIDWSFQAGDNSLHYPGTENALRWHFADPLTVTLRYAKDSPEIPLAGASQSGESVNGRTVSWTYKDHWSLFALLNQHPSLASEFNSTPERLRSTVRFVIPVVPDTSKLTRTVPPITRNSTETKVFLRLGLRMPDPKQPREVPVTPFPFEAPAITAQSARS